MRTINSIANKLPTRLAAALMLLFFTWPVSWAMAEADDASNCITVLGTGTAKGKPQVVELSAVVSGEGELANDASVKFRDARKKGVAALDGLNNPSLSIESKGFSVNQAMDQNAQMRMMQGMAPDASKPKVAVTEQLRIVLKDADKLELDKLLETILRLVDVGRDNGLQIGPGNLNYYQMQQMMQMGSGISMISFKVPDPTSLRDEAYKRAIDDARTKATRLAELAGAKLGRILSVQEQDPAAAGRNMAQIYYVYGVPQQSQDTDAGLSSSICGEIPLTVRLSVRFEIVK